MEAAREITEGVGRVRIELPWPPTVNTYYRHVGPRVLISKKGREYRKLVAQMAMIHRWEKFGAKRLSVVIKAYPPDKRRRDLDNLQKSLFDSMQHAGIYDDDSQIDYFSIERMSQSKYGIVRIEIEERIGEEPF